MTRFQALYVLYLRHKEFCDNSWRELASNYYDRYTYDGNFIDKKDRIDPYPMGGNQLEGMNLEKTAFKILRLDTLFLEPIDLYDCDLTMLSIKLRESRLKNLKYQ